MPGYVLRALLSGVLLVILAWVGIVLGEKLHGRPVLLPVMLVWAVVVAAVAVFAIRSATRSRRPPM